MSDDKKEGRYLTADGPITLAILNPKAIDRFKDRVCETCEMPIMGHYIRPEADPDLRAEYWCHATGNQYSLGLKI